MAEKTFVDIVSSALERGGRAVPDKRLQEMTGAAEAGEYALAAERAKLALEEGITDIRVIGYYLFGAFLEEGSPALEPIFSVLSLALSRGWDALYPEERKERIADSALSWLFRNAYSRIDFHAKMRDATWKTWLEAGSPELSSSALEAADSLRTHIDERIDKSRAKDPLSELEARIREHFSRSAAPQASQPTAPGDDQDRACQGTAEAPHAQEEPAAPKKEGPRPRTIEVSPALASFLRKIEVFEDLIRRGDLARAAIVAQDIRLIIESFDPRVYLPRMLLPYFRLLTRHVEELEPHWENMESPQYKVLGELYRVDLEAFLAE